MGARNAWRKRIIEVTMAGDGALPPAKKFKAKHDLPELADYRKPAPDSFWEVFPCNRTAVGKSMISGRKLEGMARAAGCWTPADQIIIKDLELVISRVYSKRLKMSKPEEVTLKSIKFNAKNKNSYNYKWSTFVTFQSQF